MKKTDVSKSDISTRRWIRASEGENRYPWCYNTLIKYAVEAGALHRIGSMVMIDAPKLDEYIEAQQSSEN